METFPANKETASPALPFAVLSSSMQACGSDKPAHTTIETSRGMPDFPVNRANPRFFTEPATSTTVMKRKTKKKKKQKQKKKMTLSVRRNEYQHEVSSGRLEKFCKRCNGLFKKAHELSNLCNAEVGVIVASPSGKVSEFASSSMSHILTRYQSFQRQMPSNNVLLHGAKKWKREGVSLSSKLKDLQELERFSKNMPSSINVVQSFEAMLIQILDEIRKRKMELLEVEIQKIIQQGEILLEENIALKEKLIQVVSTKESISNAISESEEFCYQEDNMDINFQHGLDILQYIEEESSNSSKKLV